MAKLFLLFATFSGALSVVLGAFAAHGLKNRLEERLLSAFETGVTYQFYHALALLLLAILVKQYPEADFKLAGYSFIVGILLFCGSLYLLALTGIKWFGPITPLGGLFFIFGWISMAWTVWSTIEK